LSELRILDLTNSKYEKDRRNAQLEFIREKTFMACTYKNIFSLKRALVFNSGVK
jgi:hypothetical protein